MRTVPPGLSVDFFMGPRNTGKVCRTGRGYAMRSVSLGPSVELPHGHETCEGCTESGVGTPRRLCHWGLRWSVHGAAKRVRGVPNRAR
eukprot:411559-Pyramimonas_sp.AAC.1